MKLGVKVYHTGGSGSRNTLEYRLEIAMNMDSDLEVCFKEKQERKEMQDVGTARRPLGSIIGH